MQHHTHHGRAPSHGFKVGIGALAVTALYEWLLEQPLDQLDVEHCCALWAKNAGWEWRIGQLFSDPELAKVAWQETRAKSCAPEELRAQLERLRLEWPSLRDRLRRHLLPFAELKQRLETVGAPVEPEQIGISRAVLRESYWRAFFIRRRFTALDLAVRTGLLDESLRQIFGRAGRWPSP
jgi:glycerol-1-phosphate dehydrogenase [NAD(P)+]